MRALLLSLTLAATAHAKPKADPLVVPSVKISFEVPAGWHELTSRDIQESRKRIKLSDPELTEHIQERAQLPKLTFTKHPSEFPSMNPTLQVYSVTGPTPEEVAKSALGPLKKLDGFTLVEGPRPATVKDRKALFFRATFPLTHTPDAKTLQVEARMLLVSDGKETAVFGFSGPASGPDRCEAEFQRFLATIKPIK